MDGFKIRFKSDTYKLSHQLYQCLLSVVIIGVTAFFCSLISDDKSYYIVSFILLLVVSLVSTFLDIGPLLLMSTLSALVWNFFFIPPILTFHIEKTEDILILGMFFIIVFVNGILTNRIRKQERLAKEREQRSNALYNLSKRLSSASGINEVVKVASEEIEINFKVNPEFKLAVSEENIISFSENNCGESSIITERVHNKRYYVLKGAKINVGQLTIQDKEVFPGDKKQLWETFLAQITNSLEKEFLAEIAQKARLLDESEKLFKTLFNSISHELRIPVSAIMGAADTLIELPDRNDISHSLYKEIFTASIRLNRLIENLLNMSRLESGRITPRLVWCDVNDLVVKINEELNDEILKFKYSVYIQEDMPLVKIDFGLMEQVLYNLIYNSCVYTPEGSAIILDISYHNNCLIIRVFDNGPGFQEDKIKYVFNRFYRIDRNNPGGLGLGLSIVKGFVEAHKGTVSLENGKKGGAEFTIIIPSELPILEI